MLNTVVLRCAMYVQVHMLIYLDGACGHLKSRFGMQLSCTWQLAAYNAAILLAIVLGSFRTYN